MNEKIISIRYPFGIDRGTGVLAEEHDYALHVRQMIMQVLLTNPGERVNRPDFGCGLRRMVFAPNSDANANIVQVMVTQALDKWLGDVIDALEIHTTANNEKLQVSISYVIRARQQRQFLNLEVSI
jgi:uncharacterized protein